jgi:hypothetical protein
MARKVMARKAGQRRAMARRRRRRKEERGREVEQELQISRQQGRVLATAGKSVGRFTRSFAPFERALLLYVPLSLFLLFSHCFA